MRLEADGRDLPNLARLARNDPNFRFARSVGVILDVESNVAAARSLADETLAVLGATGSMAHGTLTGSPAVGAFLTPDGESPGAIETLCRTAVMISEPDLRFHQAFEHRQGIDPTHAAFAGLRSFVLSL